MYFLYQHSNFAHLRKLCNYSKNGFVRYLQEKCEAFVVKVEESVTDGPYKEMLLLMLEVMRFYDPTFCMIYREFDKLSSAVFIYIYPTLHDLLIIYMHIYSYSLPMLISMLMLCELTGNRE